MFNETDIRSVDEIFHQLLYKQLKNNCTEEYDQKLQGLSVLDIRIIDVIVLILRNKLKNYCRYWKSRIVH